MFLSRTPERIETERHLRDVARLEEVRRLEDLLVAYAVLLHRFLKGEERRVREREHDAHDPSTIFLLWPAATHSHSPERR